MSRRGGALPAGRLLLLWALFFLICFGLGYPVLNRYDARRIGNAVHYYPMVEGKPGLGYGQWRFRVLVPLVAKPVYRLSQGWVRSWDPVAFGLLVANSLFCAATVTLLLVAGYRLTGDYGTALLASTLYLLNFEVANSQLAGQVDAGEACVLMLVVLALLARRDAWLPVLGIVGVLAKESFALLSLTMGAAWWLTETRREGGQPARAGWIAAMGLASVATAVAVQSVPVGKVVWPWQLDLSLPTDATWAGFLGRLVGCLGESEFWYLFIWLLPLGLGGIRQVPRPWVVGAGAAAMAGYAAGAYHGPYGVAARAMFDAAGPMLSLAAAIFLLRNRNMSAYSAT